MEILIKVDTKESETKLRERIDNMLEDSVADIIKQKIEDVIESCKYTSDHFIGVAVERIK